MCPTAARQTLIFSRTAGIFTILRRLFQCRRARADFSARNTGQLRPTVTIFAKLSEQGSHIGLFDQREALKVLPQIPSGLGKDKESSRAVARKTGTDVLPVETVQKTVTKTASNSLLNRTINVRNRQRKEWQL